MKKNLSVSVDRIDKTVVPLSSLSMKFAGSQSKMDELLFQWFVSSSFYYSHSITPSRFPYDPLYTCLYLSHAYEYTASVDPDLLLHLCFIILILFCSFVKFNNQSHMLDDNKCKEE